MPLFPEEYRLPHDPRKLVREVDAAMRVREIERVQRYKDALELKWWESGLILLMFVSGLGFIITIYKLIPAENQLLFWFVFFWFALFVCSMLAILQFVLVKISALRKLFEMQARDLQQIQNEKHLPTDG